MFDQRKRLFALLAIVLMLCVSITANAQDNAAASALTVGVPLAGEIKSPGEQIIDAYTTDSVRKISLQALGETVQPTLTVLRDGQVIAAQPNAEGKNIVTLDTLVTPGQYIIQVGGANNTIGMVVLVLQSETPVSVTPLTPGTPVSGAVSAETPLALYNFISPAEPALLYIDSGLPTSSASVRVVNAATGQVSGAMGLDMTGARFRIPGAASYQVEVSFNGTSVSEPYTLCLTTVSAGGCEGGAAPIPTQPVVNTADCTVTPLYTGGANVRQSASTDAPIVTVLPGGAVASVLGISPDGYFYNITYNGITAWVALSAITASGSCAGLPIVNPPPIAATAVPPTAVVPTAQTPPTAAPPVQTQEVKPTDTPSGPCLITMKDEAKVYTQPNAQVDYLFDEVQQGYQLSPVGRLADNSWWKTSYGDAWIQTSLLGDKANLSGDCSSLPVVSP